MNTGIIADKMGVGERRERRFPAWLLSALLHGLVLIGLAFITPRVTRGVVDEADREAGIVLVKPQAQATEYWSDADAEDGPQAISEQPRTTATATAAETIGDLPGATQLPIDLAGVLPTGDGPADLGAGAGLLEALPGGSRMTDGPGPARRMGGKGRTYVFGVEGEGSVFVYVFDRSNSMRGFQGRPLAAAKSQLLQSLKSLESTHQFQIMFYNESVSVLNPLAPQPARLLFATDANKDLAEQYVHDTIAAGSTRHLQALQLALRLAPDVIFFLTDAAEPILTDPQLEQLRRLNAGTVVHAIEFGEGPAIGGDNFLKKLARQHDGQHRYVDVTALP